MGQDVKRHISQRQSERVALEGRMRLFPFVNGERVTLNGQVNDISQTAEPEGAPVSKKSKNKKKKGGMLPPVAGSQGVGGVSKLILGSAAVGAVTALAVTTTGPPASPSRP